MILDSSIITKKCDKGKIITYIDENDFIKEKSALRKYFMRAYKDLQFNTSKRLRELVQEDGDYEIELYTEKTFQKIYGQIKIRYFVKDNLVVIKDIVPREILIDLYKCTTNTYKGVPYRNNYDLFKIKFLIGE